MTGISKSRDPHSHLVAIYSFSRTSGVASAISFPRIRSDSPFPYISLALSAMFQRDLKLVESSRSIVERDT